MNDQFFFLDGEDPEGAILEVSFSIFTSRIKSEDEESMITRHTFEQILQSQLLICFSLSPGEGNFRLNLYAPQWQLPLYSAISCATQNIPSRDLFTRREGEVC
jgi:hypothetical protein